MALTQVHKSYTTAEQVTPILRDINITINSGDSVALVGSSGSGKSTLMNIMGLLDKPTSGTYHLGGKDMAGADDNDLAYLRNHHIGFVFQQFNLLPRFTAFQNVALPLSYRKLSKEEQSTLIMNALDRVGMADYAQRHPSQLSGGQQQRIAIARAIVGDPQMILADEPTGALDSRTGQEVMQLFKTLHQEGRTLILVTHDERIAMQCRRRLSLADGQIMGEVNE